MRAPTRSSRHRLVLLVAAGGLVLAGCSSSDGGRTTSQESPSSSITTSTAVSRAPTTPAPQALADLARRSVANAFTATYALDSTSTKQPDATVTIARMDTSYRIDIVRGSTRAVLLTSEKGIVSCQLGGKKRLCLLVAEPGKQPPRLFDPGVQRLVTSDLESFASRSGLSVEQGEALPAEAGLPAAQCFTVRGKGVDEGEYCLTDEGLLRRATFPSGTLTLTKLGDEPSPKSFDPPVKPTPLPRISP